MWHVSIGLSVASICKCAHIICTISLWQQAGRLLPAHVLISTGQSTWIVKPDMQTLIIFPSIKHRPIPLFVIALNFCWKSRMSFLWNLKLNRSGMLFFFQLSLFKEVNKLMKPLKRNPPFDDLKTTKLISSFVLERNKLKVFGVFNHVIVTGSRVHWICSRIGIINNYFNRDQYSVRSCRKKHFAFIFTG